VASPRLIIERLASHHDRGQFDCGVAELNAYLQKYSGQHDRKGIGRTYVATEEGDDRILGFYTISSGAVAFDVVPENVPHHPVPVALIGRLAVDKGARGLGLGETLLMHALRSARAASKSLAVYAVVVDALNERARTFYLKYGFKELADDHFHLYLPMNVISKLGW
jgi:GNAT superfamily N-acetyltransferase